MLDEELFLGYESAKSYIIECCQKYIRNLEVCRGRVEESEKLFKSCIPPAKFALIKISGSSIKTDRSLKVLGKNIACLHTFGLYPVVVTGAGPYIDDIYKRYGIPIERYDGERITRDEKFESGEKLIDLIEEAFMEANKQLVEAITGYGGKAISLSNIITAEKKRGRGGKDLGLVGKVVGVNRNEIVRCTGDGVIPVICPFGISRDGSEKFNINADIATKSIYDELKSENLLLTTEVGGVRNKNKELIEKLSLEDLISLRKKGVIIGGMGLKSQIVEETLHKYSKLTIFVISPDDIIPALFVKKGGTKIVKE